MLSILFSPIQAFIETTLGFTIEFVCLHFPLLLGAYCSISLMKVPDLSIESAYVCGAILGARMLHFTHGLDLPIAMLISFLASILGGVMVGLMASTLTQKAKFPHLLSSILTTGIFHGVNQFLLGSSNVSITARRNLLGLLDFFRRYPELPSLVIAAILLALLATWFFRTKLGVSLAVYGNNPRFFENYGISSRFVFTAGLMISNGLAGLGGFFDAQASGFVDINMGALKALFCITSIILGRTLIGAPRQATVLVPLVGSLTYFGIMQGLLKINFNLKYFTMVNSIIVAGILITQYRRSRMRTHHLGV